VSGGLRVYSLMNEEDSATLDVDDASPQKKKRRPSVQAIDDGSSRPDWHGLPTKAAWSQAEASGGSTADW